MPRKRRTRMGRPRSRTLAGTRAKISPSPSVQSNFCERRRDSSSSEGGISLVVKTLQSVAMK